MGEITTHPNSSVPTERPSLPLSAIELWRPMETIPETWTVAHLEQTLSRLERGLRPCQPEELMIGIATLMRFGRTFNIAIPDSAGLVDEYRTKLAHLSADILDKAIGETTASWKWGNRMPMPADILASAQRHITRRMMLQGRAEIALRKLKTQMASISPISSNAASRQAERMIERATKRVDPVPEDQMTEAEAFELLSKDRAKFFAQYPEMAP
jgi:hypothetical protein